MAGQKISTFSVRSTLEPNDTLLLLRQGSNFQLLGSTLATRNNFVDLSSVITQQNTTIGQNLTALSAAVDNKFFTIANYLELSGQINAGFYNKNEILSFNSNLNSSLTSSFTSNLSTNFYDKIQTQTYVLSNLFSLNADISSGFYTKPQTESYVLATVNDAFNSALTNLLSTDYYTKTETLSVFSGSIPKPSTTPSSFDVLTYVNGQWRPYTGVTSVTGSDKNYDLTPVGSVIWHAASAVPPSYLVCDGSYLDPIAYKELFEVIYYTFGKESPTSNKFRLPDLRGEFVRGWDRGRSIDSGRIFGSQQKGTIYGHDNVTGTATRAVVGVAYTGGDSPQSTTLPAIGLDNYSTTDYPNIQLAAIASTNNSNLPQYASNAGGSGVTRPRNVALLPCIKHTVKIPTVTINSLASAWIQSPPATEGQYLSYSSTSQRWIAIDPPLKLPTNATQGQIVAWNSETNSWEATSSLLNYAPVNVALTPVTKSYEVTNIPSGIKRITITFRNIKTSRVQFDGSVGAEMLGIRMGSSTLGMRTGGYTSGSVGLFPRPSQNISGLPYIADGDFYNFKANTDIATTGFFIDLWVKFLEGPRQNKPANTMSYYGDMSGVLTLTKHGSQSFTTEWVADWKTIIGGGFIFQGAGTISTTGLDKLQFFSYPEGSFFGSGSIVVRYE